MFARNLFALLAVGAASAASAQCGLDARNSLNVPLPAPAQGAMSPALAADLRRGYDLVGVQFKFPEGEQVFNSVRDRAAAEHNICAEGLAVFGLGIAARASHLNDALPLYRHAEELLGNGVATPLTIAYLHQRIGSAQHAIGNNPAFVSEDAKVREELRQAGDPVSALQEQSLAYQWGTEPEIPENQQRLVEQLRTMDAPNATAALGMVQWEWGSILRRKGYFVDAVRELTVAQTLLKKCDCMASTQGSIQLDLALVAVEEHDTEAILLHAQNGDRIYHQYNLENLRPQAMRLMGTAYQFKKDFPHAIATFEEALRLARETHANALIGNIGQELSQCLGESGQPLRGIDVLNSTRPAHPTPRESCLFDAITESLQGTALQFQQAYETSTRLKECEPFFSPVSWANMEWVTANAEMETGHLDDALTHAKDAVARLEVQRLLLQPTDRSLTSFSATEENGYTVLIEVLLRKNMAEEALLVSEQYRARAFVDLAASREVQSASGSAIAPSGEGLLSAAQPFALTQQGLRDIVTRNHTTLVSYWFTTEGKMFTWVMRPGEPVFETTQTIQPARLLAMVTATLPRADATARGTRGARVATRGGGTTTIGARTSKPWQDLYALLIAPIEAHLPKDPGALLTLVPQGPLFEVAFPALMNSGGQYLVERFAINTVSSAGVLNVTAKNELDASKFTPGYLLVANPQQFPVVEGHPLSPLPGTATEVRDISRNLDGQKVLLLQGREAGIDSMGRSLPQSTVLHLATHAVVSDDAPMTSFLALDRSQRGGMLTTASIYGLRLHANLVVLSACGTGRGAITGDGVAGLSRAFLYAGAASLVTTLWDVVDQPTAKLMPSFYAALAKGESRSTALRTAQLSLIHDLRDHKVRVKTLAGTSIALPESPTYWAAFSLSGQP